MSINLNNSDYNVVLIFFDNIGKYSHTLKCPKSTVYNHIEEWSRHKEGMCQIIDMRAVIEQLRQLRQ